MKHKKSSRQWLNEHFCDHYVKLARKEGYRARAAYKLLEITEKHHLLKPGMIVVDLGAAPGSWAELAVKIVGHKGRVIATDRLEMNNITGVEFVQGDFTEKEGLNKLLATIDETPVDLVLSDMAPNISGMKAIDQPRMMVLAELALDLVDQVLKPGGNFLVKIFQGEGFDTYLKMLRERFDKVMVKKPMASRPRSKEVYLLACGFQV